MLTRFLAILAVLAACKSGDDPLSGAHKPDETRNAIQGAWTMQWEMKDVALEITGNNVKKWDGTAEKTYTLDLKDPCQIGFKEPGDMGSTHYFGYVTGPEGKAAFGQGDAGMRTPKKSVVCAGISTYVVDDKGKCKERMGGGKWSDGKCGFKKAGDKEVFWWEFAGQESTTEVDGDRIWDFKDSPAKKHADYAAAKAALAAPTPVPTDPGSPNTPPPAPAPTPTPPPPPATPPG